MIRETLRMAWSNIWHHKMRSFLTTLGVIIGVASIIALISIVNGATASINEEVASFGANKLTVQTTETPLKEGLSPAQLEELNTIKGTRGVSPTVSTVRDVRVENHTLDQVTIEGRNHIYYRESEDVPQGRGIVISDVKQQTHVAVVSPSVAGRSIRVRSRSVRQSSSMDSITGSSVSVTRMAIKSSFPIRQPCGRLG